MSEQKNSRVHGKEHRGNQDSGPNKGVVEQVKDGTYIVRIDEEGIPRLSEPVAVSSGYWVSTEGVSVHGKLDQAGIIDALDLMELHEGAVVGLWENEGLTYIDRSIHISNKSQALATAEVFNQLAIYDCSNSSVIEL